MAFVRRIKNTLRRYGAHIAGNVTGRQYFDGQVRIYPTLRCNLRCPYCVNQYVDNGAHIGDYAECPAEEWGRIIRHLGRDVVITGGEPFLYRELEALIAEIPAALQVTLYTNLMVPLDSSRALLERKNLSFFISYHPACSDDALFAENYALLSAEKAPLTVHSITLAGEQEREAMISAMEKKTGTRIIRDADQRLHVRCADVQKKPAGETVQCRRRIILVAPDGTRYQCVSHMMRRVFPKENLCREPFSGEWSTCVCPDYDVCAPCDTLGEMTQCTKKI